MGMRILRQSVLVLALAACAAADLPGIAVVELYTSEGCSSCPPAEAVLATLAAGPHPGVHFLAYHVDYWDHLGWPDPYAAARHSARQSAYAAAGGKGRVYTPEAVVNGRADVVGSDAGGLRDLIARELARPASAAVQVSASWSDRACTVEWKVTGAPATAELTLALVEDGLEMAVRAGENAGRTLAHPRVVRAVAVLPVIVPGRRIALPLPPGCMARRTALVAYVQDDHEVVLGADEVAWKP